jgi:hypothetical protein
MMNISRTLAGLILLMSFLTGCYYDNEETLYPAGSSTCDTTNVTYSLTISSIMSTNCNACHSSAIASAGVKTDNYAGLSIIALNGKLWGVVNHDAGYPPMPKNGTKLSNCDLSKINIWIKAGAPNN